MKKVMLLVVGLMFAAGANAASVTYFNSEAAFEASHYSGSVETFSGGLPNGTGVGGLTITSSNGAASVSGGVFHDVLVPSTTTTTGNTTTFEFGSAVNAFGGLWDLGTNGFGTGISFAITAFQGATEVLSQQLTSNGFFGFITAPNNLFNKVVLTAGSACGTGCQETYTLDDLRFGLHTAVPVPAALFLFAPALLGFLGLRRKATLVAA